MTITKYTNNGIEGFQIFDELGNEYFLTEATEELAIQKYNEIKYKEANPPLPTTEELRRKEYLAKGLTPDKLIVALWEKVVEGRPEEADKIQAERIAIKDKYPK